LSNSDIDEDIKYALGCKTVAVVGLSRDPAKDIYRVAEYLKTKGYRIVPVNPFADEILGEKCYKSMLEIPEQTQKAIEVVDIFRPSEDVQPIVGQAVQLKQKYGKPHVVWMQLGIVNEGVADLARRAGLRVVMDRCMMIEHRRRNRDEELEIIRLGKMQVLMGKVKAKSEKQSFPDAPIPVTDASFKEVVQKYDLVVVDFWAEWCGPCLMAEPIINELAKDYAGKVVFGKLNVDEYPTIASRFSVMGIPTLVILKNGKEVDRIVGFAPRQRIEEKLWVYLERG